MPIIDSKNGKIKKDYSIEELIEKAQEIRAYNMISITAAESEVSPTHNSHLASRFLPLQTNN